MNNVGRLPVHSARRTKVAAWAQLMACVAVALFVSGCDPLTERRYINEGAGVDLYTPDRAVQKELLNDYIAYVCVQAGASCGGDWGVFVRAGMNDIDQRCDSFLTWIDAKRRDREPVLAELSAINTAVHTAMTVTGSAPTALNLATVAFGLATATYTNWNSRLLIAVNQSTIQQVVYDSQGEYRTKIANWSVPDQATAIYLLRNYLRLCMPTTIEANINTTTTLVHSDAPPSAAKRNLVVDNTTVANVTRARYQPPDDDAISLQKFLDPDGTGHWSRERLRTIAPFLKDMGLTIADLTQVKEGGGEFARKRRTLVEALRKQKLL